jgi:hypothetical protein
VRCQWYVALGKQRKKRGKTLKQKKNGFLNKVHIRCDVRLSVYIYIHIYDVYLKSVVPFQMMLQKQKQKSLCLSNLYSFRGGPGVFQCFSVLCTFVVIDRAG